MPGYLVEGHGEAPIYVVPVEQGNTHDATNKVEIGEMVWINGGVRIDLQNNYVGNVQ